MNIAILGPGGIADDQHAPAVIAHPDATLWSVLSRSQDRAMEFANRHSLAAPSPAHTDLDSLLKDPDLDAVIIATPDRLHASQVIAAAKAAKHVLLEKPMATSLPECDEMIVACNQANVTLAMGYHLRWHAGHRRIRNAVANGLIGAIRHMRLHWTFAAPDDTNWRSSTETGRWWALAANGTHCLDIIRWFMLPTQGEITDVRCLVSRAKFGSPHDETSIVLLHFESGATAEFSVSVQFASESRIELYGDNGNVQMEGTMGRHGAGEIQVNGQPFAYEVANPFLLELDDFITAVQEKRTPEVSMQEGRNNVATLLQAIEASGVDSYHSA